MDPAHDLRLARWLRWGAVVLYAVAALVAAGLVLWLPRREDEPARFDGLGVLALYAAGVCITVVCTRPKEGHATGLRTTLAALVWPHAGVFTAMLVGLGAMHLEGTMSASGDDVASVGLGLALLGVPAAVVLPMVAYRGWTFALVSAGLVGWSLVRLFMA